MCIINTYYVFYLYIYVCEGHVGKERVALAGRRVDEPEHKNVHLHTVTLLVREEYDLDEKTQAGVR